MRILIVHNWYRSESPSGENRVVEEESRLLRAGGHEVHVHGPSSDDIATLDRTARATLPLRVVWSSASKRELTRAIERFRPDVVHLHNTFPLLSPSVLAATRAAGLPVVATLHNYRLVCPGGTLFRGGTVCHDCLAGSTLPGVRHGCYRDSSVMTVPIALSIELHTRRWQRSVDAFVALSTAQADIFTAAGFPADRMVVKPNFVPDRPHHPRTGGRRHVLCLGRLTVEKGIRVLRTAWSEHAPTGGFRHPLVIAGAGPLDAEVRAWAAADPSVEFLGQQSRAECSQLLDDAVAVVVPSVWEETFGLVVIEAKAAGVPAVASDHASFPELIDHGVDGLLVPANDAAALARAIASVDGDRVRAMALGAAARRSYEAHYTPERNLRLLEDLYERVRRRTPRSPPVSSLLGLFSGPRSFDTIRQRRSTSAGEEEHAGG
jgi:glycosyltransferase involved in cell wall biosynthesis